jgi:hypothetical protein
MRVVVVVVRGVDRRDVMCYPVCFSLSLVTRVVHV